MFVYVANPHARTNGEQQTPIHYAAKFNAVDSVKYLIQIGAKVWDRDYKERTPLFLAAEYGAYPNNCIYECYDYYTKRIVYIMPQNHILLLINILRSS